MGRLALREFLGKFAGFKAPEVLAGGNLVKGRAYGSKVFV